MNYKSSARTTNDVIFIQFLLKKNLTKKILADEAQANHNNFSKKTPLIFSSCLAQLQYMFVLMFAFLQKPRPPPTCIFSMSAEIIYVTWDVIQTSEILDRYGSISKCTPATSFDSIATYKLQRRDLFLNPVVNAVVFLLSLSIEMVGYLRGQREGKVESSRISY